MPWFWGRKHDDDDDESSYEEYTDSEEEEQQQQGHGAVKDESPPTNHRNPKERDEGSDAGASGTTEEDRPVGEGAVASSSSGGGGSPPHDEGPPSRNGGATRSRSSVEPAAAGEADSNDEADHQPRRDGAAEQEPAARGSERLRRDGAAVAAESGSSVGDLDDSVSSEETSDDDDEQLLKGVIPEAVEVGGTLNNPRSRADSALSYGSGEEDASAGDDDDASRSTSDGESAPPRIATGDDGPHDDNHEDEGGPDDNVTSASEKRSLLVLAAEHDRVDILQAILAEEPNKDKEEGGGGLARDDLLHGGIPPLHVAVSHGSVNATNFLLRKGADPSVRPTASAVAEASVDVPNRARFEGVTAWELAFGDADSNNGGGKRRKIFRPVDLPPSKREGIRHAFTAEALRCIGSDEIARLRQLLGAGVPPTIDIGGRDLHQWCVEMGAAHCAALLRPGGGSQRSVPSEAQDSDARPPAATGPLEKRESRVLDRGGEMDTPTQLSNRLDELESLGRALSVSLDGLAEEVSVCNGLLLMGGGASALASHVRGLKATKESKLQELERMQDAWENSEDELAYWAREGGPEAQRIAVDTVALPRTDAFSMRRQSSLTGAAPSSPEEAEAQRKQLLAQVAASEQKIRKLRASIADLSEVCARDLAEVERRGLSGGITLVRGLREELREIEYQLAEAKNGDATCRTKIRMIQSKIQASKAPAPLANGNKKATVDGNAVTGKSHDESSPLLTDEFGAAVDPLARPTDDRPANPESMDSVIDPSSSVADSDFNLAESQRIAAGQSTAIAVRHGGERGFFPLSLWQILLRIIGFGDDVPSRRSGSSHSQVLLI